MLSFRRKFYDEYGNFNNEKFIELLNESKKELYTPKKKGKAQNIQINLFNSVSKKELWSFINKMSIFVNS
jgi:hypothetical protein